MAIIGDKATTPSNEVRSNFPSAAIDLAAQILDAAPERILIVNEPDANKGRGKILAWWLCDNGLWTNSDAPWDVQIAKRLHEHLVSGINRYASQKALVNELVRAVDGLRKRVREGLTSEVREAVYRAYHLYGGAKKYASVTHCKADELDADTTYIGCSNGVVSLREAKLLAPDIGREKLISKSTGIDFDPTATSNDVDNLFRHLSDPLKSWWAENLGVMMYGDPARRFFFLVGPPKGGKTTMADALLYTLGNDYVGMPADTLFSDPGKSGSASPEFAQLTQPRRIAIIDEVNKTGYGISPALLKKLSGSGFVTYRHLYECEITRKVTATLLLISNPMSVPKIRANDSGVRDRLRQLIYPEVPNPDHNIKERIKDLKFRKAFLAWLVNQASRQAPGSWPEQEPNEVIQATLERVDEDIGAIGRFARRVVDSPGDKLTVMTLWLAWCRHNEVDGANAKEAGGVKFSTFSRRIRALVEGLPPTKAIYVDGKSVKGWLGWRLADEDDNTLDDDTLPEIPF